MTKEEISNENKIIKLDYKEKEIVQLFFFVQSPLKTVLITTWGFETGIVLWIYDLRFGCFYCYQ